MSNTLKFGNGKWAVKENSTLAYNDENGNFKPLPFTFDRSTSATRVNKEGLIEVVSNNEPRIDFLNDSKGALKLEPSRSNLITYSEDFANSSVWGEVNTTFTDNETQSPSGILTGKLTRNVTTFSCIRDATVSTVLGTTYVFSAFYKKDTETTINHGVLNQTTGYVTFNFDTETISITRNDNSDTISTDGFGFEKYANGWYRVYLKFVRKAGSFQAQVARQDSGVIGQSTFIYGAQVEQGSYATSYIPTQGSIGTRVAETCSDAGNDQVFNDSEGVLFAEIEGNEDGTNKFITISDGSIQNRVTIIFLSNNIVAQVRASNSEVFYQTTSGISIENYNKIAVHYKTNQCKLFVNGFQIGSTDTSAAMPSGLNTLEFKDGSGVSPFYGSTKQIQYFDTALTDAELISLTKI
mgnify:FL=1